jgi:glycosyltransferase involved in cell wall biosynthesis
METMRVCFAAYEGITLAKGGPYIKIMETKKYLELQGVQVDLFNMWEMSDKLNEYDIINIVGSNFAVYAFARNLYERNINFLVEPVFFSNKNPKFISKVLSADKILKNYFRGIWTDYGFINDICNWADLILPNTSAEANLIQKSFTIQDKKIKIVPNGVSSRFLEAEPDLFYKKYGVKDFILYVGQLGFKRKNGLSLVKAVNQINAPAVIIGKILDNREGEEIRKESSKNKNLILIDYLPNDSPLLASAYAACDTFALPSEFETPGIAALEAALAGAKIVITPNGGTQDYFLNYAEYIKPESITSIKEKIELSLKKPKSVELRNHIKENYLWEHVSLQTLAAFKNYMNEKV